MEHLALIVKVFFESFNSCSIESKIIFGLIFISIAIICLSVALLINLKLK